MDHSSLEKDPARTEHNGNPENQSSPPLEVPERIGTYRIVRLIANGGQSTVYEAVQENPERTVALKVIRPGMASSRLLRRFELEAQVLGRLQHRGIAQIYEAGTETVGHVVTPYFAMEFIRGRTLLDYAKSRQLDSDERLGLMISVCEAVHYAHQKGVIHRDLKPGNIMVSERGQPKILDFGVARATDSDIQAVTIDTNVGELLGTIPYMSPEQVKADPDELDIRSDVYTLGVITFELLADQLPYKLDSMGIHQLLHAIQEDDPLLISSVNRTLRGDVETIVGKALEKDRMRRYLSAAGLAADLKRYLNQMPIEARPPTTIYQLKKFAHRNKALMGGLAATFVALVLGLAGTGYFLFKSNEQRDRALQAEQVAKIQSAEAVKARDDALKARGATEKEAAKVKAINDFILDDMLAAPNPWVDGRDFKVVEVLDRAAGKLSTIFKAQPEIEGALCMTIGRTYFKLGMTDKAVPHIWKCYRSIVDQKGEDHPDSLSALHLLGELHMRLEEYAEAKRLLTTVIEKRSRVLGETDADTFDSMRALASVHCQQGRIDEMEKILRQVEKRSRETHGAESEVALSAVLDLGWGLSQCGKIDEAKDCFVDAEAVSRQVFGDNHPQVILAMSGLADVYMELWETKKAEEYYRRALAASKKVFGDDHPDTVLAMVGLGAAVRRQRQYEKAASLFRESVDIYRDKLGADHQWTCVAINHLGGVLINLNKHDEAEVLLKENLAVRQRVLEKGHPHIAESLEALGLLHYNKREYEQALAFYQEGLGIFRARKSVEHPDALDLIYNLTIVHERMGNLETATSLIRELVDLDRKVYGPKHRVTLSDTQKLMSLLLSKGDSVDAEAVGHDLLILLGEHAPDSKERRLVICSMLGEAIAGQRRYNEAEPYLLDSLQLVDNPDTRDRVQREALQRVVNLYVAWGKPEKAEAWQSKLDKTGLQ